MREDWLREKARADCRKGQTGRGTATAEALKQGSWSVRRPVKPEQGEKIGLDSWGG